MLVLAVYLLGVVGLSAWLALRQYQRRAAPRQWAAHAIFVACSSPAIAYHLYLGEEPVRGDHFRGDRRAGPKVFNILFVDQDNSIFSQMAAAIADSDVLLCREMGAGAYESMKQAGIRLIMTDIANIDEAVRAYVEGCIVDRVDRLH